MYQEGVYFGSGIQNDAHILADVAREKAAIKSAAGISKMMCRHRSDYRICIVTGALEKKTQAVHIFAFIAATASGLEHASPDPQHPPLLYEQRLSNAAVTINEYASPRRAQGLLD
jgi:hypothetical protein